MAIRYDTKQSRTKKIDEELKQLLDSKLSKIKIIGCGGSGNNTITRLMEAGVDGAETIIINTDAQDLLYSDAHTKILIGKNLTKGLGAGGDPQVGMEAAKENREDIKKALEGSDMIFITCGLGGGTGTGSAPVVAEIAKSMNILTVGVVTLPFSMEGQVRMRNALQGLKQLRNNVDTLVIIPNDKLLEVLPDVSIHKAFYALDEILVNAVKGTVELITKPGLVNLDFADVKSVMRNAGLAMIGLGESHSESRAIESVTKAMNSPFLPVEINGASGALISIVGGPNLTLSEANEIVKEVAEKLEEDAKIIWGAKLEDAMKEKVRTMIIITGVKEKEVYGQINMVQTLTKTNRLQEILDIKFVS
ncbi:MAG: cell division protein FtsZ [Candidatus Aenigmatarchaeota archaeon]|nr:cell division protein FtsZ [Candidatus Aenigmarchaeota archaeon]